MRRQRRERHERHRGVERSPVVPSFVSREPGAVARHPRRRRRRSTVSARYRATSTAARSPNWWWPVAVVWTRRRERGGAERHRRSMPADRRLHHRLSVRRGAATASNLNFVAGQTIPNAVDHQGRRHGSVCLFTSATTHLIVDIAGYFADRRCSSRSMPRLDCSTRGPMATTTTGSSRRPGIRPTGGTIELSVAGRAASRRTASAVVLNVTVDQPRRGGLRHRVPGGRRAAERIEPELRRRADRRRTRSSPASAPAARVCLFNSGATHLIVDVAGYYAEGRLHSCPSSAGAID